MTKNKNFTIYWSHYEAYKDCPRKFLSRWGWEGIDLGYGEGNPIKLEDKDKKSQHHMVLGSAVQYGVEKFYNDKLWKDPQSLKDNLKKIVTDKLSLLVNGAYIDWKESPSLMAMQTEAEDAIIGFLRTVQAHKLLDIESESEAYLLGFLDEETPIGAYVDILIKRNDGTSILLDGKNSKSKDKYLKKGQLLYYCLTLKVQKGYYPDKIGWVFYRYPHQEENGEVLEEGVKFLEFSEGELNVLAQDIIKVRKDIVDNKFEPTPSKKVCRFCEYEKVCESSATRSMAPTKARAKKKEEKLEGIREGKFLLL